MRPHIVALIDDYLRRFGDRPRAVDATGEWTGNQLSERARRLAGGLRAHGVGAGDRVAVMMANSVDVFVAYEAVWRAGAAITPIMPALVASEVAHILGSAQPAAVLTSGRATAIVAAARQQVGGEFVLVGEPDAGGDVVWADVESAPPLPAVGAQRGDDLAALLFTGGTTGRSKGVMLSHEGLVSTVRIAATGIDPVDSDVSLVTLPLSHGFGIVVYLVSFLDHLHFVVHERFEPTRFVEAVRTAGVTTTDAVPAMLQALLDSGHAHDPALRNLRSVYVGGSYCPPDLMEAFEAATGTRVYEGYGMTESGALIAGDVPSLPHRRGTVGRPYAGVEVRVVDPDGNDVATGEVGEIIARSAAMMVGYWRDPAATAEAVRDGWLYTGDLGSLDADGYLAIRGRRKELIIRNGFNVYPTDLENVIRECRGVTDVCVVGIPDRVLGERVVAAVIGDADPEEIVARCADRIGPYKRPDDVVVVAEIPLTRVGKPDRATLAALLSRSLARTGQ
ncbi:class I adenylate-forming enzyme family protein [Pseudonocardia sp. CA-107938]|uniref:class I adenylate-forming enzyme family protein n=1 Tax=Pseudonocardia sp. CA-107938 TaxID=3240021 RepID=UPI003D909AD9